MTRRWGWAAPGRAVPDIAQPGGFHQPALVCLRKGFPGALAGEKEASGRHQPQLPASIQPCTLWLMVCVWFPL